MNTRGGYAFAELPSGGLLVDLVSGLLFQLNESATFVWRQWLDGEPQEEIVAATCLRYGLTSDIARRDVATALDVRDVPTGAPASEFHYRRSDRGYVHEFRGRPILEVDAAGERLWALAPAPHSSGGFDDFLNAIAPKLLALRGHFVLHGAAVSVRDRVLALAGPSGAGKTTAARALVRAGAEGVGEDKLVLRLHAGGAEVVLAGESAIAAWVADANADLRAGRAVSCRDLDRAAEGTALPLAELGFVDATRRRSTAIGTHPLTLLDTAGGVFKNAFYGSDAPREWQRQLQTATDLAGHVLGYELTMPNGLPPLAAAAASVVARGGLSWRGRAA